MTTSEDSIFASKFRNFIEQYPLYAKFKLKVPEFFSSLQLDVVEVYCNRCKSSRPFHNSRPYKPGVPPTPRNGVISGPPRLESGIYNQEYECAGCQTETFDYWVEVDIMVPRN